MKRTFKIALLLCLISLVSALMLTACNSKDNPAPEETSQHIWSEWIAIKEVKCEENGLLQRYCTECNYTESKPIDALGHTEVIVQAVAPTCTQNGWTEGKYCSTCNEVFAAQTTIDVLGHSYTPTITPPTATENGSATYTCSNCGDTYTEANVPADFTVTEENRAMIGFTGEANESLIIPAVFQHNGIWYIVTTIGDSAFRDCSNLTSVTIPDSVTTIGERAFECCSNLTSVTIGDSVTTISSYAFCDCSNLASVTIPDSVTTIGDYAFAYCENLTSIVVDENNPAYQSINGNLYSKDGTVLMAYAVGKTDTSFTIPDSVTTIGNSAFYNCSNLTEITIPDSVTTIGVCAFSECYNLTSVTIPDSVITIGERAFTYCENLTSIVVDENNPAYQSINGNLYSKDGTVLIAYAIGKTDTSFTIPDSVTAIDDCAFFGCYKLLTSVTIGDSVTTIGNSAFSGCFNLTSITFEGTVAQWNVISKGGNWQNNVPATSVICSDGTVTLK